MQAAAQTAFQTSYYDVSTSAGISAAGYGGPGSSGGAGDNLVRLVNSTMQNGSLCAMIYAFDDRERMQTCCGCPVSPDGMRTLSTINDLTLDFGVNKGNMNAGVIKVVSSTLNFTPGNPPPAPLPPGTNSTDVGACSPTGAFGDPTFHRGTAVNPTAGIEGWITHDELVEPGNIPAAAVKGMSAEHFESAPPDPAELTDLQKACESLIANGSGTGICACGINVPTPPPPPPPLPPGSCLPSSSLSVLIQGTNVSSYVPNGSWSVGATDVQLVPVEGSGISRATIATPNSVNSCSSNSFTGETVCTANNSDVYLISGPTLTNTLTSGGNGQAVFSGGVCTNCGVTTDPTTNTAVLNLAISDTSSGFQFLDLGTNSFAPPIGTNGPPVSEDLVIDPIRHIVLSPSESGQYQILGTTPTTALFNFAGSISGELDSAAEDCTTAIALSTDEFTSNIFIADLSQATFTPGSPVGTWSAPSQLQSLPEFGSFSSGTSGIAIASGSHLGIVTGEFGGSAFGVIQLPSTSGSGTPSIVDWVAANIPVDPDGIVWAMGNDPHPVTAYVSPNNGRAFGLIANLSRTFLAVIDLQALLAAPRIAGTHDVDPGVDLVTSGIVRFVSIL